MESWKTLPHVGGSIGNIGFPTQKVDRSNLTYKRDLCKDDTSTPLWDTLLGSGQATTVTNIRSGFRQCKMHYGAYPRPSHWLGISVPYTGTQNTTLSPFNA